MYSRLKNVLRKWGLLRASLDLNLETDRSRSRMLKRLTGKRCVTKRYMLSNRSKKINVILKFKDIFIALHDYFIIAIFIVIIFNYYFEF